MIHGNLEGIRNSVLAELEKLYDAEFERDIFLPEELLKVLVYHTEHINREMLVYLGRDGSVLEIAIGSIGSIALPELHLRRNLDRLSGFRCIHTHPGGDARLSSVDLQALRLMRFDSMCAVGVQDGKCTGISAAFLGEVEYDNFSIVMHGPVSPNRIPQQNWMNEIEMAEERVKDAIAKGGIVEQSEKVMLISTDSEESLEELASLAETAGAMVITRVMQNRQRPDPATFIGSGKAEELSRLGGGIGTRGPGETQLEVDRRRIRKRIDDLNGQLKEIKRQRDMRRARRDKQGQTTVALVGYTNAGKSTLLNALSGADVLVEDKLFATLDPVMRNVDLPENRSCLLVDTVGFIRKLPHQLVEAFHSTLEEALYADLLVVVSDASNPQYRQQRETVFRVLEELGAGDRPVLEALNKADRAKISEDALEPADAIIISAQTGRGLDRLKEEISKRIAAMRHRAELLIPYDKGNVLSLIHGKGQVLAEEYLAEGTKVDCLLDSALYQRVLSMLK